MASTIFILIVSRLAICQSILSLLNKVIKKAGHLLVYSVLYLVCSHMNNELKYYISQVCCHFSHTLLYLDVIHNIFKTAGRAWMSGDRPGHLG